LSGARFASCVDAAKDAEGDPQPQMFKLEESMTEKKKESTIQEKQHGSMTVEEAGRLGGHKGGQRERELVEKGHQVEETKQQPPSKPSGQQGKN
jgi:hypothetical protein